MKFHNLILLVLLLSLGIAGRSQDTLASMRLFVEVCNNYKELPVQMDMDVMRSSNLVVNEEDTTSLHASFCLRKEGSYIGYGELEQLANDSVILLVNNKLKRMIAYPNAQSVSSRLKEYLGWQMKDSSLTRLAGRYVVSDNHGTKDTSSIIVMSRQQLAHTNTAVEELQVRYNTTTRDPYEIRQITRKLVPMDSTIARRLANQTGTEDQQLVLPDGTRFLVWARTTVFRYGHISHPKNDKLPVSVMDRIVMESPGKYKPVKAYTAYTLTQQF